MNLLGNYSIGFGICGSRANLDLTQAFIGVNGGAEYNMEGPPRRSSSLPAANATCCCDDDKRIELGENNGSLVYDDSVIISAANQKTPHVYPHLKTLAELKAEYGGKPDEKVDYGRIYESMVKDKAMESFFNDKAMDSVYNVKAMESTCYVKPVVSLYGDKAMDSLYDIKAVDDDIKHRIYHSSYDFHDLAGADHEFIHIFTLTGDDSTDASGNADEVQQAQQTVVEPAVSNIPAQPQILGIREQADRMVADASEAFTKLKAFVDVANADLQNINHPRKQIPADLMAKIQVLLTDCPGWFLSVLDGKEESIDALHDDVDELRKLYDKVMKDNEELRLKIEEESSKPLGMSAVDQQRLNFLGVDNLNDLIIKYRHLQIQVSGSKERRLTPKPADSGTLIVDTQQQPKMFQPDRLTSSSSNMLMVGNAVNHIPIPMPGKFDGKTRIDLERYLRYFDQAVLSRGYPDSDKAIMIGNYVPTLQFVHDKLIRKNASYFEIKSGLLNALGSDSDVATFTLRTSLDRIKKSDDKSYKKLLEVFWH
uniref:Uncharacterized protein n=1 Tax=Panagrolaimus sp. ES5 TaxID=591445 RepID=A0AC34FTF5_9BILA